MEKCYTVAETVKMTGVKSYVLRYWEEELSLPIRRNELGHRCYTQNDIQLILNIKELKNRGLQLRAIHDLLPKLVKKGEQEAVMPRESDKIALLETEIIEKEEKCEEKCEDKILEFQEIMERLITQELHAKKEGEERWRTLDEAIRKQQMARREAAAASEKKNKKKNRIQR
nr:helix-turn-helix domain-containing protein [uncultured Blautia sp.]